MFQGPQKTHVISALAGLVIVLCSSRALAQQRLVLGLSGERMLMGSTAPFHPHDAQMRFSVEGLLERARLDADSTRLEVQEAARFLAFSWDTAFGVGDDFQIAARFQIAYQSRPGFRRIGPQIVGIAGRYTAQEMALDGLGIGINFAFGKEMQEPGNTHFELDGVFSWLLGPQGTFDVELFLTLLNPDDGELIVNVGGALGPFWRPNDWFALSVEALAEVEATATGDALPYWLTAAGQLTFTFLEHSELSLGGSWVVFGANTRQNVGAVVGYRHRWRTEDGLLNLDDDGGPNPEPDEPADQPLRTPWSD